MVKIYVIDQGAFAGTREMFEREFGSVESEEEIKTMCSHNGVALEIVEVDDPERFLSERYGI